MQIPLIYLPLSTISRQPQNDGGVAREVVTTVDWATVDKFPQQSSCHQKMVDRGRAHSVCVCFYYDCSH